MSIGIFYTGWGTDWTSLFLGAPDVVAVLTNNYFRQLALASGTR